jgi:hypothetical protein
MSLVIKNVLQPKSVSVKVLLSYSFGGSSEFVYRTFTVYKLYGWRGKCIFFRSFHRGQIPDPSQKAFSI